MDKSISPPERAKPSAINSALSALHGRSIALQLEWPGHEHVLFGVGNYERDCDFGRVLRIVPTQDGGYEFLLVEGRWSGEILPGQALGCDFLIHLESPALHP